MKIKLFSTTGLIILLLSISLVFSGLIVPRFIISSNLQNYEGEKKVFGRYAFKQAGMLTGDSAESFMIVQMRVTEIKQLSNFTIECGYDPYLTHHEYKASIRLYSWFGIAYGEVSVTCNNSQIKRYHIPDIWPFSD